MRPATAWAAHVDSQIAPMTSASELEYRAVRRPPTCAHRGESSSAWRPTFCSFSDSPPSLPGGLDSGEPRWTNQTVSRMYSVNWRYSDCQFSITSAMNDDEVR